MQTTGSQTETNNYIVYKHTTPSGKVYIGITCQKPTKRWKNGLGYEGCTAFFRAVKKYGWNNIEHDIVLSGLSKESACSEERRLIAKYKSNDPEHGYNLTDGGEHYEPNDEWREKLSASLRQRYIEHPEDRVRISESQKGRRTSAETKTKQREARLRYLTEHLEARRACGNSFRGKKRSAENVRKLREANKKPIVCNETGVVYKSINEAAEIIGVARPAISNNLTGRSKSCKGLTFSYYGGEDNGNE